MKYDLKFKLDCVLKYKKGRRDFVPIGIDRTSFLSQVRSWAKSFDELGIDGLKHSSTNKAWTLEERFDLVSKVLAGNSIRNVAFNAYINNGQLYQWVKKYRENGMDGLKYLKRGRPKKGGFSVNLMPKKKTKLSKTEQEELKLLRERNKYLEAENLYLKKLRALELEKTAKLAKAKKQESSKPSKKKLNAV